MVRRKSEKFDRAIPVNLFHCSLCSPYLSSRSGYLICAHTEHLTGKNCRNCNSNRSVHRHTCPHQRSCIRDFSPRIQIRPCLRNRKICRSSLPTLPCLAGFERKRRACIFCPHQGKKCFRPLQARDLYERS